MLSLYQARGTRRTPHMAYLFYCLALLAGGELRRTPFWRSSHSGDSAKFANKITKDHSFGGCVHPLYRFIISAVGRAWTKGSYGKERRVSTEQNKAILRQVYEAAFHQKNLDALDEVIASDSTDHNLTPEQPPGLEGAKQVFSSFHTAFPDLQVNVEDMISEGDKVVARLTVRGTHQGEFMGITPTGNQVTFTGIDIVRIADGKVVERWGNFDDLGMMQQLGLIEQPSG